MRGAFDRSGGASVDEGASGWRELGADLHRGFSEFLWLPALIAAGFLLLSLLTTGLDRAAPAQGGVGWLPTLHDLLRRYFFADPASTSTLLSTIAGGLFTVTSITFSVLLLAVQQSASLLSGQVFDQFLRRRLNQVFLGFFVGLALYTLTVLTTVNPPYNPVFGAMLALLLSLVALLLLGLLIYVTIHQMRPAVVLWAIHDHTLRARARQRTLLIQRTRRASAWEAEGRPFASHPVHVRRMGFLAGVDLDTLGRACAGAGEGTEVVLLVPIGTFLTHGDVVAELRIAQPNGTRAEALADAVREAIRLNRLRELESDPAYGIEQLASIGWTSISTSKQNPVPGLIAIYALRDLLVLGAEEEVASPPGGPPPSVVPVVYRDDGSMRLLDALESLAVVASESMQHQCFEEVVRSLALAFDRLPAGQRDRTADVARRILSGLGDHILTAGLDRALSELADRIEAGEKAETAAAIREARRALAASVGVLNSRSTRVPGPG